jgi:4-phytase/acid phosphatase
MVTFLEMWLMMIRFCAMHRQRAVVCLLMLILLASFADLARAAQKSAPAPQKPRLAFALILARHGVRAPSSLPVALDRYSARDWPVWPVAPDNLTHHGYILLRQFGAWDRAWLAQRNLLAPGGCEAAAMYIYTDSDERTIASGHALAAGLSPACAVTVHSLPEGQRDPLFHVSPPTLDAAARARMLASVRERMGGSPEAFAAAHAAELKLLQAVLDGCRTGAHCKARPGRPELRLNGIRNRVEIKGAQARVTLRGPVFTGASLAEDMLLEYTQGMPRGDVAWGLVNRTQLNELIALHTAEFAVKHRTPALARVQISDLLGHILDTLQQAVQQRAVPGAWGTPGQKLVLIDGHDTNLAAIAGLLHLHWTLDGRRDDTPPGSQLQFLVYRDARGGASIEMRIVMQTLHQMRGSAALTAMNPPASASLKAAACTMKTCVPQLPWTAFERTVQGAIDPRLVLPFSQP